MIRKLIRWLMVLCLLIVTGFVVWFALVNYNVIDNPYEEKVKLISLSQSEIRLKRKNTYQLTASIIPGKVRNGTITYTSSNPSVATVNEKSGFIKAIENGTTVITATLDSNKEIKAECNVIVSDTDVGVNRIEINTKKINLTIGESYPITYKLSPRNATLHSIEYVVSDDNIIKVSNIGKVIALSKGRAIVTVIDKISGVKSSVEVEVYNKNEIVENNDSKTVKEPKSISLLPKSMSLNIGASRKIEVSINPTNANPKVTWRSLNTDIATVNSDGVVIGRSEGTTKIVGTTVNGLDDYIDVTVGRDVINVNGITVLPTSMELKVGETKEFSYDISPLDATDQGVMISSSDDNIIRISNNKVMALKEGTTDINFKTVDGGYKATIKVKVSSRTKIVNEKDLTVKPSSINIPVGGSFEVEAKISPVDATYKELNWKSNDPNVATVNNGLIVGVSPGKTEIVVSTINKKITKRIVVNVSKVEIKEITLDKSNEVMKVGETLSLIKTVNPTSASNQTVYWDSSNTSVAIVNSNGVIKAVGVGKATITVRTSNGKVASCLIEVTK